MYNSSYALIMTLLMYLLLVGWTRASRAGTTETNKLLKIVPQSANTVDEKWSSNCYEEYPISLPGLHRLLRQENKFYELLKGEYLGSEDVDVRVRVPIYKYLTRYKAEVVDGIRNWNEAVRGGGNMDIMATLNHPFLIFQMLRRLVYDFPPLYSALLNTSITKSILELPIDLRKWPSQNDVNYYGSLIVVLHHFYDFGIHRFGRGLFGKIATGVNLSAVQSVELNYIATKNECHSSAVDFMAFAWDQVQKYGGMSIQAVRDAFETSIKEHDTAAQAFSQQGNYGLFTSAIGSVRNFTRNRHQFITRKSFKKHFGRKQFPRRQGDTSELEEMDSHNFMSICKGENWQSHEERKHLKCWYRVRSRIAPYRMELLSKSPLLLKVHDFTGPSFSESLIEFSYPRLQPAKSAVEGFTTKQDKIKQQRAGLVLRVGESYPDTNKVQQVEEAIEWVTGLSVRGAESGERLQVASSISGGFLSTHLDSLGKSISRPGHSRLGTFMIFLNRVEAGGRTAFHQLGLAIRPTAHSAVFWLNHYKNGTIIETMVHGGCPVVLGQKWVATKWIRSPGNFHKYKCSRSRNE